MKDAKKLLTYVTIGVILLTCILELILVSTNLSIKTLDMQAAQWKRDTAKKEYELVRKQIENENLRFKVYKTMENNQ